MNTCIAYITAANLKEAETIASHLVSKKIAACVNILPNIKSYYMWEEKIAQDNEYILFAKTTTSKFRCLVDEVNQIHSYETPCILKIPISEGNEKYISWLIQNVN